MRAFIPSPWPLPSRANMTTAAIWNIVGLTIAVAILAWYGRLTLVTWREERRDRR